jgi:hypothetical protein
MQRCDTMRYFECLNNKQRPRNQSSRQNSHPPKNYPSTEILPVPETPYTEFPQSARISIKFMEDAQNCQIAKNSCQRHISYGDLKTESLQTCQSVKLNLCRLTA